MHPGDLNSVSQVIETSSQSKLLYKEITGMNKTTLDPMKDPYVKSILKTKLPEKLTYVEGTFFRDSTFPEETLRALLKHPKVDLFEAEHAIYTTDVVDDLEELVRFIFNIHELLVGK
jgi:hypothetical protein